MNNPYAMPAPITSRDDWRLRGACRDHNPDIWFPARSDDSANHRAVHVCFICPVLPQCRRAGADESWGVWGGTTEAQRHPILQTA